MAFKIACVFQEGTYIFKGFLPVGAVATVGGTVSNFTVESQILPSVTDEIKQYIHEHSNLHLDLYKIENEKLVLRSVSELDAVPSVAWNYNFETAKVQPPEIKAEVITAVEIQSRFEKILGESPYSLEQIQSILDSSASQGKP